jgi:hypothetical protein
VSVLKLELRRAELTTATGLPFRASFQLFQRACPAASPHRLVSDTRLQQPEMSHLGCPTVRIERRLQRQETANSRILSVSSRCNIQQKSLDNQLVAINIEEEGYPLIREATVDFGEG